MSPDRYAQAGTPETATVVEDILKKKFNARGKSERKGD
jgi:hypothetical protein